MTMKEPQRFGAFITAIIGFVVGLLLFLADIRSSGAAPQTLRLKFGLSGISEAGILLMLISMGAAAWLFIAEKRGRSGA